MEQIKLFDAELRLMELIWQLSPVTAKDLSLRAAEEIGWNKNTTYTVLKKLVAKKAVKRGEPNFVCTPLVTRSDVGAEETRRLIDRLYDGSSKAFLASFLQKENLSQEEMEELRKLIDRGFGEG